MYGDDAEKKEVRWMICTGKGCEIYQQLIVDKCDYVAFRAACNLEGSSHLIFKRSRANMTRIVYSGS